MKNYPSVLIAVALIASVLLQEGDSFRHEGYEPDNVLYAPIKGVRPGYVGDWNLRRTWSDVGHKRLETDGWGPDYGRRGDDLYAKWVWEKKPEKIWRGEALSDVKGLTSRYDARSGDWDRKGPWHKPGYRRPVVVEERKDVILNGHRRPVVVEERKDVVLNGHRRPVVVKERKDVVLNGHRRPVVVEERKDVVVGDAYRGSDVFGDDKAFVYSFRHKGYEPENVLYAPIKDVRPGYVGDWNSRRTGRDVGCKWLETGGWGHDYGRRGDDWYAKRVWEKQPEKIWRGEALPKVKGLTSHYDARRGDWDRKSSWHKPGYRRPVVVEERKDVILNRHRRPVVVEERKDGVLNGHRRPFVVEERKDMVLNGHRRPVVVEERKDVVLNGHRRPVVVEERKDVVLNGHRRHVVAEERKDIVLNGHRRPFVVERKVLNGHRRPVVVEEREDVVLDGYRESVVFEETTSVVIGDGYRGPGVFGEDKAFVYNQGYKGPGIWDGRKHFISKDGWNTPEYEVPVVIDDETDFVVDEEWNNPIYEESDLLEGNWNNLGYEEAEVWKEGSY